MSGGNRFHQDTLSQLGADTQSGIADLADEIGLVAEQGDFLLLAETHFPEAAHDFLGGAKLLDAHTGPGLDLVQRTKLGAGAIAFHRNRHGRLVTHNKSIFQ